MLPYLCNSGLGRLYSPVYSAQCQMGCVYSTVQCTVLGPPCCCHKSQLGTATALAHWQLSSVVQCSALLCSVLYSEVKISVSFSTVKCSVWYSGNSKVKSSVLKSALIEWQCGSLGSPSSKLVIHCFSSQHISSGKKCTALHCTGFQCPEVHYLN